MNPEVRIDEILNVEKVIEYTSEPELRAKLIDMAVRRNDEIKQLIRDVLDCVIGEAEERPEGNGSSSSVRRVVERNRLRNEMRAKIKEIGL